MLEFWGTQQWRHFTWCTLWKLRKCAYSHNFFHTDILFSRSFSDESNFRVFSAQTVWCKLKFQSIFIFYKISRQTNFYETEFVGSLLNLKVVRVLSKHWLSGFSKLEATWQRMHHHVVVELWTDISKSVIRNGKHILKKTKRYD